MNPRLRPCAALAIVSVSLGSGATLAQTTERVSVATGGTQGNAHSYAMSHSISADGRVVAFESFASNLVAGDTNAAYDIFVHDRTSGTTERVSVDSAGVEGNGGSAAPSISADARFVALHSSSSNLVAADTNGDLDVFVRDRQAGTTERVSVDSAGMQANGASKFPVLSADGRFVAFYSIATNLVPGDTNGVEDIFVRDRTSGTTERVSVATGGAQANFASYSASISADGRFVAFDSFASNLVAGDTNFSTDIFVHDRTAGTTERVSVDSSGAEGNSHSYWTSISGDGRFVVFDSVASNLVAGDTNGFYDVFVRDRASGTTERVSVATGGTQANDASAFSTNPSASISADGRFVAFWSYASNLVAGDTNARSDVFVRDQTTATTERVSVDTIGAQANDFSLYPSLSADGRFVALESFASNLVAGDTNGLTDVFVRDRGPLPPRVYCTSSTSSSGCNASIAASANPSHSLANVCTITVTSVEPQQMGILFYGIDNAGFPPAPWSAGSTSFLCVKQPAQRTQVQNSGGTFGACDGSYALDWNAYQTAHSLALGNPWSVGDDVFVQAWFRDPPAAKSTNLSDALALTYLP